MNGQPRINAGFLVGHCSFREDERRNERRRELRLEKRAALPPARKVKGKRRQKRL